MSPPPNPSTPRTILHIDMDAFFAAVEILDRPELRGLPVIVGGTPEGHGVVSTASYEARKFGVRSAMPAAQAVRLCPQGIFLAPRFGRYAGASRLVMEILHRHAPRVEQISIDEAFLDVTGCERLSGGPLEIARRIKKEIFQETGGLTASVGIAPNKFLAKVASDHQKPDGLCRIAAGEAEAFLAPLPVSKIWGVGPKTAAALAARGYHRIGDLQKLSESLLVSSFGEDFGRHLYRLSRGLDDRDVEDAAAAKSISAETTLEQFLKPEDHQAIERLLLSLCDEVATRMWRENAHGFTVTIKVRDDRFVTRTRSWSATDALQLTEEIYPAALKLYRERIDLGGRRLRLLGVGVSRLVHEQPLEVDLFRMDEWRKSRRRAAAVERIRERLGDLAIVRGSLMRPLQDSDASSSGIEHA